MHLDCTNRWGILARNTLADPAITRSSADGARRYYRDISKSFDGLSLAPGVTTLDDVTSFVGYPISGDRLETLDPGILMDPERLASEGGMGVSTICQGRKQQRHGLWRFGRRNTASSRNSSRHAHRWAA